ncbi:hypothetical protein AMTR_s05267p00002500, partial [Amborella trichopoda]
MVRERKLGFGHGINQDNGVAEKKGGAIERIKETGNGKYGWGGLKGQKGGVAIGVDWVRR